MRHRRFVACATAVLGVAAVSCSGGKGHPTVPATPAYNPRVAPSVGAYLAFVAAVDSARKHPSASSVDFAKYSTEPVRTQTGRYLAGLRRGGKEWRGTPPKHAVVVLSTRLDAKPLPTVTLGDCPIAASSWAEYLVAKGSKISTSPARPAHRTSVEVVQRSGHWLVSHIATDPKHVCR